MTKIRTAYFCASCGFESAKWEGKCPSCNEWNTFQEEVIQKETKTESKSKAWKGSDNKKKQAKSLSEINIGQTYRHKIHDKELNRVLGGGIVPGAMILVAGQPGIGKSTLLLQLALQLKEQVLYVSGEESEEQIKMRATRLGMLNSQCYIYTDSNVINIIKEAKKQSAQLLIIDSIQTISSPYVDSTPGTVSQLRETATELQRFSKESNIPIFIIGHITKEGSIAGPKLLEHIVDVVLQFEGDQKYAYRILRTLKNRFGSTDEIGIYEMQQNGMRQVSNPSELLLSQDEDSLSGSTVAATLEGVRPILIETQALVTKSVFGTPQRSATGFDLRRLSMLLAVLEKRCSLPFGMNDVFLNIAGGIKVSDPSIDLAIVSSLISSLQDIEVDNKICFAGEVGLSGEIRAVSRIDQRIQEADRLGFEEMYLSKFNLKSINESKYNIKLTGIASINDLLYELFS